MAQKTLWGHSILWFGAAVSLAEIWTGALMAPLGLYPALAAILLGHAAGCFLLFGAGWIGARHSRGAMDCVKLCFGPRGGNFFALLNLLQLTGWTAVMISAGNHAASGVLPLPPGVWIGVIALFVLCWRLLPEKTLNAVNSAAVLLLFLLTLFAVRLLFARPALPCPESPVPLTFGRALELSIAMPLSYLPLIADYTCDSSRPLRISFLSAGVYFSISCWMYFTGLAAALNGGSGEITVLFVREGFGIAALVIALLSAVTAAFIDVFSAGMTMQSLLPRVQQRNTGIFVTLAGAALGFFCNTAALEPFLCWISSLFAPMIAVQLADALHPGKPAHRFRNNLLLWAAGFLLYRALLYWDLPCGSSLPAVLFSFLLSLLCGKFR